MKRLVGAFSAAAMGMVFVQGTALAAPPSTDAIAIDLSATLIERCGLSAAGNSTSAEGRLDRAENLTFNFAIDCNTPFRIGVSSANGGMRLASAASGSERRAPDGFAIEKRYRVALAVDTDSGPLTSETCQSDDLTSGEGRCDFYGARSGEGLSSGRATAINRAGSLQVSWRAEDEDGARHAAGRYQDTLTVVVGPRT